MDRKCRFSAVSTILILGSLIAGRPARAFDVTVSSAASTNGSFVGGVWTPTANSILSFGDLNTQLASGNAGISTAGGGTITVSIGFQYTNSADRMLTLSAAGDVSFQSALPAAGPPAPGKLSVTVSATGGSVVVGPAGVNLNGGSLTSSGIDFRTIGATILTGGGAVVLTHSGAVLVDEGGLQTGGGSFRSSGTTFGILQTGLQTGGGAITLDHTGAVSISQGGARTGGGPFTSAGTSFTSTFTGVQSAEVPWS